MQTCTSNNTAEKSLDLDFIASLLDASVKSFDVVLQLRRLSGKRFTWLVKADLNINNNYFARAMLGPTAR